MLRTHGGVTTTAGLHSSKDRDSPPGEMAEPVDWRTAGPSRQLFVSDDKMRLCFDPNPAA